MSVESGTLENREKDLELSDREKKKREKERERQASKEKASTELETLKERISAAKFSPAERSEILKHDSAPHCGDCFARGWLAAVRLIEGG